METPCLSGPLATGQALSGQHDCQQVFTHIFMNDPLFLESLSPEAQHLLLQRQAGQQLSSWAQAAQQLLEAAGLTTAELPQAPLSLEHQALFTTTLITLTQVPVSVGQRGGHAPCFDGGCAASDQVAFWLQTWLPRPELERPRARH
jgi:hypothetical protein